MVFTPDIYKTLLQEFLKAGYPFQTFEDFLSRPLEGKTVVLRHDIDKLPYNAFTLVKSSTCWVLRRLITSAL